MSTNAIKKLAMLIFAVLVLIIGGLTFTERVPEGKVAVVYSPANGAKEILNPGWHLLSPFEKTQLYPTRITIVDTKIAVTTSDGKKIDLPVKYEMKVDKDKVLSIFKELGSQNIEQIQQGFLYQKLFATSREVVSGYSVLDIFGVKTTEASNKITDKMAEGSIKSGFVISNVTLGNPEVDAATQAAIDARVQAAQQNELKKQQLENEKIEAQKKAVIAQGEADKKIIEAKALADATLLNAEAQAEANKKMNASLTENVLKKMEMEARIEHGWITVSGSSTVVTDR